MLDVSAPLPAEQPVTGRLGWVRRGVVGLGLFTSALTSPALERFVGERIGPATPGRAAVEQAAALPAAPAPAAPSAPSRPTPTATTPVHPPALDHGWSEPAPPTSERAASSPSTSLPLAPLDPAWRSKLSADYVVQDAGCAADVSSATGLDAFFAEPVGTIKGFDEPRTYPLGDGRTLWVLQDAFTDETGSARSFAHMGYANSMVLIQDGTCFTSLRRGTLDEAIAFEIGTGDITFDHYFWPAGGTVANGVLQMFWMEMVRDDMELGPLDGIALHPVATWLATYDVATMQRLSFAPAPDPGVSPVYGYHVADSGGWSYLFGNSFVQNLALEGGAANGPHSATREYLARVPQGHLDAVPTYWDGGGWSTDPGAAVAISSRNWIENLMLPSRSRSGGCRPPRPTGSSARP